MIQWGIVHCHSIMYYNGAHSDVIFYDCRKVLYKVMMVLMKVAIIFTVKMVMGCLFL